jgi:hypothetical protein
MILTFIFCYHNYQPDLWFINVSRILQLAELFKLQSYQRAVKVISNTLLQTYKTFFFLYWFVMLLVVVFGAIMFSVERGELTVNSDYPDGEYLRWNIARTEKEPTPFISLATSMWYTLVSITTVGYGDMVPTSVLGRAVGACLLLLSFLIVALPITVIGEAFANAVDEYNSEKVKHRASSSVSPSAALSQLHSLENLLRESLESNEEKVQMHSQPFTMNPIRRSLVRSRSMKRSSDITSRNLHSNNDNDAMTAADNEEKEQQMIEQWIDYLQQTTSAPQGPPEARELLELQFQLFQNYSKRKEIENEYFVQLQIVKESELMIHSKIQQLMIRKASSQDHTHSNGGDKGKETGKGKEEETALQREMQSFEIQS